MSKKGNDSKGKHEDFKNFFDDCLNQAKDEIKKIENKKFQETERHKKVQVIYDDWVKQQRPEAEKAVQTIIEWVNQFLVSDIWRELVSSLHGLKIGSDGEPIIGYIYISRNIIYEGPSPNPYHPYGNQGYQSFSLDLSGNLFVHNNVKYGKSYRLRNVEDILRYSNPVVLIEAAKTIQDGSIWNVMQEELQKRLKRCIKRSNFDVD